MESNKFEAPEAFDPLCVSAEGILSTTLGNQIYINKIERLTEKGRRNLLLRCRVNPVDGLPSSFILKKVETETYDPDEANSGDMRRFFNDWVGSQFLNTLPSKSKHSPHFYGADRHLGFIILEDVKHRDRLVEPLLGNDIAEAEWALLEYATCLGQLHADTLGKATAFEGLYKTISPSAKPMRATINIPKHQSRLESLGIQFDSNCLRDLEAIAETVSNPGEFLAYIHADACPDNVLNTGEELRLIDFETGFLVMLSLMLLMAE